jgi:hypothetical protein
MHHIADVRERLITGILCIQGQVVAFRLKGPLSPTPSTEPIFAPNLPPAPYPVHRADYALPGLLAL